MAEFSGIFKLQLKLTVLQLPNEQNWCQKFSETDCLTLYLMIKDKLAPQPGWCTCILKESIADCTTTVALVRDL